jgi:hypothetical protein
MKPKQTIKGKHVPDPDNCLRCWEQANDPVYAKVQAVMGITARSVEHGEPEVLEVRGPEMVALTLTKRTHGVRLLVARKDLPELLIREVETLRHQIALLKGTTQQACKERDHLLEALKDLRQRTEDLQPTPPMRTDLGDAMLHADTVIARVTRKKAPTSKDSPTEEEDY